MELEEVHSTHTAKRCPRCGEVTLRGSVRWAADSTCRSCKFDFAEVASGSAGSTDSGAVQGEHPNDGSNGEVPDL